MKKTDSDDGRLVVAFGHLKSGNRDLAQIELQALICEDAENAVALQLLGNMSYESGDLTRASSLFRRALANDPLNVDLWCNLATVEFQSDRFADGSLAINRALARAPDSARAYAIRGTAHARRKQDVEALNDFALALKLNPNDSLSAIHYWACACRLCWWAQSEMLLPKMTQLVSEGFSALPPFSLLSVTDDPMMHLAGAANRARRYLPAQTLPLRVRPDSTAPFKVAYLSADFHDHATTYLMAGVFEYHDKKKVETIAVSIGPTVEDSMRARVGIAFDHFVDAHSWTDTAIAQWLIDLEVHILVDLKGHTEFARPGIVALKPAPLVVSYLGYPGTSGMPAVDYIIGDPVVTPMGHQASYSESIVQLPHCYQCNDRIRPFPQYSLSREMVGLPPAALVLAAFNHPYKIRPDVFDTWCRILNRLPGSVLWVLCDQPQTQMFLLQHAATHAISPERIVFARRLGYNEHLARHALADLFLDTWPYSGHTTASDALWMGLPVLTLMGETFASRVAASLLQCVGLRELVVDSLSAYEEKAVALAENPACLKQLKAHLNSIRWSTPLFDTAGFTKHLESAYTHMIERWQAGVSPAPFTVNEDGSVAEGPNSLLTRK